MANLVDNNEYDTDNESDENTGSPEAPVVPNSPTDNANLAKIQQNSATSNPNITALAQLQAANANQANNPNNNPNLARLQNQLPPQFAGPPSAVMGGMTPSDAILYKDLLDSNPKLTDDARTRQLALQHYATMDPMEKAAQIRALMQMKNIKPGSTDGMGQ